MRRLVVIGALILTAGRTGTLAFEPKVATTRPAAATQPTSQTASSSSGDKRLDAILERLEARGHAIKGLKCDLTWTYVMLNIVPDEQIKQGELLFARAEPNAKFLVHFDKLIASGVESDNHEYYVFDGQWLIERRDKDQSVNRRQIARPGERNDPFKLGKGPFPLPFGQTRADMLANFKITLEPPVKEDPPNTDHLHCIPLSDTELAAKYKRVEMFIDKQRELPVRIVTERVADGNRIEVDFKKVDLTAAPAGSRFNIETPKGFSENIEPLEGGGR